MANAPLKIKRFPAELWDLSKPQSFDNWFIKTWSNKNAINIPSKCDLNAKAVVLARATVRQAWLSALEASTSHIRKPAFDAYKSVSVQTKELKTNFDGLIKFLQYRGEPPNGQEAEIQSLTRNVLLWLEASPLDEEGDFVAHDFESCSKFAASLLETRKFLSALEQQAKEQIERHRHTIYNVVRPELNAFALPFIEAAIFMTGLGVGKENIDFGDCLNAAWNLMSNTQQVVWESQIRSATKLISTGARKCLKRGLLPCLNLQEVGSKLLQGQTRSEFLQGCVPN